MHLSILAKLNTGYARSSEMYNGKDPELESSAVVIVKWLLGQVINKSFLGYVDYYYISAEFAEELEKYTPACMDNDKV
jgi:hypothetical protein